MFPGVSSEKHLNDDGPGLEILFSSRLAKRLELVLEVVLAAIPA
jgi:hypothetical protein